MKVRKGQAKVKEPNVMMVRSGIFAYRAVTTQKISVIMMVTWYSRYQLKILIIGPLTNLGLYRISDFDLPDIQPFLISSSGSCSSCKLPDNEPDNLLIYY